MIDTSESQQTETKSSKWDRIMELALAIPGARVDRENFLRVELSSYCDEERITKAIEDNPAKAGISLDKIDKIANSCIKWQTRKASAISFATGLPGGWAMLGTIPVEVAQFYYNAIILSQKLAYLYGWPRILKEGGIDEETKMRITLLIGVMLGVGEATKVITKLAQEFAIQTAKRLPRQALTKTAYYPIVKQIGGWIGIKITKTIFARSVARVIPVIGGITSGLLTMTMMRPMAKRLQDHLKTTKFAQP